MLSSPSQAWFQFAEVRLWKPLPGWLCPHTCSLTTPLATLCRIAWPPPPPVWTWICWGISGRTTGLGIPRQSPCSPKCSPGMLSLVPDGTTGGFPHDDVQGFWWPCCQFGWTSEKIAGPPLHGYVLPSKRTIWPAAINKRNMWIIFEKRRYENCVVNFPYHLFLTETL